MYVSIAQESINAGLKGSSPLPGVQHNPSEILLLVGENIVLHRNDEWQREEAGRRRARREMRWLCPSLIRPPLKGPHQYSMKRYTSHFPQFHIERPFTLMTMSRVTTLPTRSVVHGLRRRNRVRPSCKTECWQGLFLDENLQGLLRIRADARH